MSTVLNARNWDPARQGLVALNSEPWVWQPILLTTLAAALGTPFAQADWPVPSGARPAHVGFVQGTYAGLLAQPKPFAQLDWPLVRGVRQELGSVQGSNIALFAPSPAPFAQYDWPLVLPKGGVPRGQVWSSSPVLQTTPTMPGRQLDWPLPGVAGRLRPDWPAGTNLPIAVAPTISPAVFAGQWIFASGLPS